MRALEKMPDFQAEYESSIPPHPLRYFLERWPRAPDFILTNAATSFYEWSHFRPAFFANQPRNNPGYGTNK